MNQVVHNYPPFELNEHGNNKKIVVNLLEDKMMRTFGFTDYRKGYWYFCKPLFLFKNGRQYPADITFNFTINKSNPQDYAIDVLDEGFCQPYDYQYMVARPNCPASAYYVYDQVEETMRAFMEYGIIEGHIEGEYI